MLEAASENSDDDDDEDEDADEDEDDEEAAVFLCFTTRSVRTATCFAIRSMLVVRMATSVGFGGAGGVAGTATGTAVRTRRAGVADSS